MGLFETVKSDIEKITSNLSEWGGSVLFTAPLGETASVVAINVKHHTGFDEQGFPVNSTIASVAISEKFLTDANYPVRPAGEVDLDGHLVAFTDSTGTTETYMIRQWFPDEAVGLIVCILGKYE